MTKLTLSLACLLASLACLAQPWAGQIDASKITQPQWHYQNEYTFDKSLAPEKWTNAANGLNAAFGSTEKMYFRTELPDGNLSKTHNVTGWKGQRVNAILVTWSADSLEQVRLTLNDLKNTVGGVISKSSVSASLIRNVVSNFPYNATNTTCGEPPYVKEGFLLPDRLEKLDRYELPGNTVRSIWISIDIPERAEPGTYHTTLQLHAKGQQQASLEMNVQVLPQTLPAPRDWKHRLDLWQNPWVIAWYFGVEPWSEEHMMLLKKHLKLYADAGGTFITTYAVHSPWSDNSYMIEGSMIDYSKTKEGKWKFDYSIFDKYVSICVGLGIDEAITIYTPIPWGNRFRYMDEASGNFVEESWVPEQSEFKLFWNIFLTDLRKHLESKGWFQKTYLGINENTMEQTLAAIRVIDEHSKDWKITYAGNWHEELTDLLDDFSFLYGFEPNAEQVKHRQQKGYTSTYYVCCNPAKPNNFVFSPPVEGRWISWYTSAANYDGFLRWAFDAWPADPLRDARHTLWPAGDCFLVYPGANSSVRYEKLREGIVDFEKIRIIKEKASQTKDKEAKKLWGELDAHLKTLVREKTFDEAKLSADVRKGNELIDRLSVLLK